MSTTAPNISHPAFASFARVLPLTGFSGAAIALLRDGNGPQFVRKAAATTAANAVLRRQAARQEWLRRALSDCAKVPEVRGEGEVDGLYYFDMEFVPSRDANAFIATAPFDELAGFADQVERLMSRLAESRLDDRGPTPSLVPIERKLAEIAERTAGRFDDLLAPIRSAVERLGRYAEAPVRTVTHGDLTFENILVSARGELWLIDPIESPIDHYWFDWAKLFQDCEGRWHSHRGKPISLGVSWWLRNRWLAAAARIAPDYPARHYLLLALTFARILPYVRSEADEAFVTARVEAYGEAALQHV
ncbi:MAG: phosphotransferase [Sphingomicrobium sp.]|nr:aminoglycoside phosphotransferase family protein [Sphingomonadales bacterium]